MLLGQAFIAIVPQMDQSAAGKLKTAGLALGAVVGGALASAVVEALDVGKANDKLRAQLGLSAGDSAKLGKQAGSLYASNYGESMDEVNSAIAGVIKNIPGMSATAGPVLKDISANALDVARVFDQDFNEVTRAAGKIMKTGLAPDAQSAMDLVAKGFQSGANEADDLLETFNEYGTQFRKLGLDGPQALGLIQQGLKGGARDADTVADALKEFSIRAIDGSKTSAAGFEAIGMNAQKMTAIFAKGGPEASKALGTVIDSLNSMKDPVARDAAGVALFGTKWEDLGASFKSLDLDTAASGLGKVSGAAKGLADQSTQARIDGFIRSVKAGFVQMVGEQVLPRLLMFAAYLQKNAAALKIIAGIVAAVVAGYWLFVAAQAAAAAATVAWTVIQRAAAIASNAWAVAQYFLNSALLANPIALVIIAVVALVAILVLAYKNSDKFREVVTKAWDAVKSGIKATVDWFVGTAWPAIKTVFEAIGTAASWLWKNAIGPAFTGIGKAIGAVFDWLITDAWPKIKPIFIAIGTESKRIWKEDLEPAWKGIEKAIKVVVDWLVGTAWPAIKKAIDFIADHMGWLKPTLEAIWTGIKVVINVAWLAIQGIFKLLELAIKALGAVFSWLWHNVLTLVWDAIVALIKVAWAAIKIIYAAIDAGVRALAATFMWLWNNVLSPVWTGIKTVIEVAWAAIKIIWAAIDAAVRVLAATFQWFQNAISVVWNAIKDAINTTWSFIRDSIFTPIITFLTGVFMAAWNNFKTGISVVWEAIKMVINTIWTFIRDVIFLPIINFLVNNFMTAWNNFKTGISVVWAAIKDTISIIWNFIRDNIFTPIMGFLSGVFTNAWNIMKASVLNVWNALRDGVSAGWNFIRDNIFNPVINFITKTIPDAFRTGTDAVGKAWDLVKEKTKAPIRVVIDQVINGGIIKGLNWLGGKIPGVPNIPNVPMPFARGGVLPGYTPGRDVHRFISRSGGALDLSGGEAIMRPEWTRAVGPSMVHMFNRMARTGGVRGVQSLFKRMFGKGQGSHDRDREQGLRSNRLGPVGRFADGGILGWIGNLFRTEDGGKKWAVDLYNAKRKKKGDGIGDMLSSAWNALTDPTEAFSNAVNASMSKLNGYGFLGDAAKKGSTGVLKAVIDFIKDKIGGLFGAGDVPTGGGGGGMGYAKQWALIKAQFPSGVSLISGPRPGAKTLSGNTSYHSSGRAVDVSPVRAVADWIYKTYGGSTLELITPWLDRMLWHGKPHTFSKAIQAQHGVGSAGNDHIHWAMRLGGLIPKLFDRGGILRPNDIGVNRTGQPEAVLTNEESRGLKNMGVDELANLLREVIDAIKAIAPEVGEEINGVGATLRVKRRTR